MPRVVDLGALSVETLATALMGLDATRLEMAHAFAFAADALRAELDRRARGDGDAVWLYPCAALVPDVERLRRELAAHQITAAELGRHQVADLFGALRELLAADQPLPAPRDGTLH